MLHFEFISCILGTNLILEDKTMKFTLFNKLKLKNKEDII